MIFRLVDGAAALLYSANVLNAIVAFFALCGSLLYYYSTSTYGKWRRSNVPHVPRPKPLFGNTFKMIMLLENQADTFDRVYRRFPGARYCGFYQMRTPFLMIRDPELIAAILVKDFSHFTDHGMAIDASTNLLARSLFFANGQKWRTMRQKLSPGFSSGKLKGSYDQIRECGEQLTRSIAEKSKRTDRMIEVKEAVGTFATDVIGTCAFGLKLDAIANDDSEFRMFTRKLFKTDGFLQVLKIFVGMLLPDLARLLKVKVFPADATEFFHSVFKDVIDYRIKNNVVRNDVAQTLIQARKDLVLDNHGSTSAKGEFIDLDIIANAILLFTAGAEPVSITTSLCLYELAVNEDIQNKLRAEMISAKQKHEGKIARDFLSELQFADMVLNEIFRKYSSTVSLMREATQDYTIPGESFSIEKGQKIVIPMYSIHHDPKYYPDPNTFNPERFSTEEKSKRPANTFFPFGDGPRQCIAKRFAEMEIKLVLSEILTKFELLPCEKTDIPLKMKIGPGFMIPENGVWLRFKPISK